MPHEISPMNRILGTIRGRENDLSARRNTDRELSLFHSLASKESRPPKPHASSLRDAILSSDVPGIAI